MDGYDSREDYDRDLRNAKLAVGVFALFVVAIVAALLYVAFGGGIS